MAEKFAKSVKVTIIFLINVFIYIPVYLYILHIYCKNFNYSFYSIPTFSIILTIPIIFLKRTGSLFIDIIKFDDPYFQFSILMDNLRLFIILFQTLFLIRYLSSLEKIFFKVFRILRIFAIRKMTSKNSNLIFCFTFLLYLITFLILTNTNTNTITWILNPRLGYQYYREGAGIWYAFSIIFLGLNSVILFIYRITKFKYFIFYSLLYTYLWYLFGGKAYIISFFTLLLLSSTIHFDYKITKKIFIVGFSSVFIIILFLFFNRGFYLTLTDSVDSIFSYFDHYYYSNLFYSDVFNSKFDFFYGKIFATNFYKYIPRAIFNEKPYVYGSVLLNEIYLPGMAQLGHTPEFAGQADYYADFGVMGVIIFNLFDLNFLFNTFFYLLVLKYAKNITYMHNSMYFAPIVFSFAPAFNQFISFPFDFLVLIITAIIFSFFYHRYSV